MAAACRQRVRQAITTARVPIEKSPTSAVGSWMDHDTRQPPNHPASHPAAAPSSSTSSSKTSAKKRKPVGAGSRGVANLTPEQLAKKRANDREAQRAIRERTKSQIETLEKRIQELTAHQPYQELQHVVRQKELVEAENEELRKRLTSILDIVQPVIGGSGLTGTSPEEGGCTTQPAQLIDTYCRAHPFVRPPSYHQSSADPHIRSHIWDPCVRPQ